MQCQCLLSVVALLDWHLPSGSLVLPSQCLSSVAALLQMHLPCWLPVLPSLCLFFAVAVFRLPVPDLHDTFPSFSSVFPAAVPPSLWLVGQPSFVLQSEGLEKCYCYKFFQSEIFQPK